MEHLDPLAAYAVEEVAALKGVGYAHVVAAIRRGDLAATVTARGVRVLGADVLRWTPHRSDPQAAEPDEG